MSDAVIPDVGYTRSELWLNLQMIIQPHILLQDKWRLQPRQICFNDTSNIGSTT